MNNVCINFSWRSSQDIFHFSPRNPQHFINCINGNWMRNQFEFVTSSHVKDISLSNGNRLRSTWLYPTSTLHPHNHNRRLYSRCKCWFINFHFASSISEKNFFPFHHLWFRFFHSLSRKAHREVKNYNSMIVICRHFFYLSFLRSRRSTFTAA